MTASVENRKLMVIINPAAGVDRPILGLLNTAMQSAGMQWDVRITHKAGDAQRVAKEAAAEGWNIIAAHGGDGTVTEVAEGLRGTESILAIFPGGTGNAMAGELGIPVDLAGAIDLVTAPSLSVKTLDMAQANDKPFLLRVGIGLEAQMTQVDQELKNRYGVLAYAFNTVNELRNLVVSHYKIRVDNQEYEAEGISCMIANSGNVSTGGLKLSKTIDVTDGLIDVVVFTNANLLSLLNITLAVLAGEDSMETGHLMHWQGKDISVEADPSQSISIDGEQIEPTTIRAKVLPQAIRVVVPKGVQ
ncbi:MAG: diacylglycerol kinase family lipid kinase [Anaerolineae bacterium]